MRQRLERLAGHRLTREGVLVLQAQGERSQLRNREEGARPPGGAGPRRRPPADAAQADQARKASKRRRLQDEKRHGALKSLRRVRPEPS